MKTRLEIILGWVDRLLLLTVAGLMFAFHRDLKQLTAVFERLATAAPAIASEVVVSETPPPRERTAPALQPEPSGYMVAASRHTISISPGGVTESRVSRVARSLSTDLGWADAPVSPAADMRERNGAYDIAFALSQYLDERSVRVTTDGNILTLSASAIGNPAAKFAKQFYIPCNPAQIGGVETNVSNGVVRVRIHPAS